METCPYSKTVRYKVRAEQLIPVLGHWPLVSIVESALCFGGEGVWVKERLCPR
jgi:hypothetical protein